MKKYPKKYLSIKEQIDTYNNSGLFIDPTLNVDELLSRVSYYRLRGYSYKFYDNHTKRYTHNTSLSKILKIYEFDRRLSMEVLNFIFEIEISLRSRVVKAFSVYQDPLILQDPSAFSNKREYWQNNAQICNDISRSGDVFIKHNYENHEGMVPVWATMEVISFGRLSKLIKTMKVGNGEAFGLLRKCYPYKSSKGNRTYPSKKTLSSWIQAIVILRNACAHCSRLYGKTFNGRPEILISDRVTPTPNSIKLYSLLLAMKYLRPNDDVWNSFYNNIKDLIKLFECDIELAEMGFPNDWDCHLSLSNDNN